MDSTTRATNGSRDTARVPAANFGHATTAPPIRVVIADDQRLVRSGFAMLINSQSDLEVVGEAADGQDAVRVLARTPADVVMMDVRMPGMDGIEATRRILANPGPWKDEYPGGGPRIVVLTTFDLDEYALSAIQAGASGFLLKDAPPEELLEAVRTVHRGDAVIAPSTTRRLLDYVAPLLRRPSPSQDAQTAAVARLTSREREVFELIAQGSSNPEIAARLYLSEATVKTHVSHILAKLEARDRVQAVVMAYATGVVRP